MGSGGARVDVQTVSGEIRVSGSNWLGSCKPSSTYVRGEELATIFFVTLESPRMASSTFLAPMASLFFLARRHRPSDRPSLQPTQLSERCAETGKPFPFQTAYGHQAAHPGRRIAAGRLHRGKRPRHAGPQSGSVFEQASGNETARRSIVPWWKPASSCATTRAPPIRRTHRRFEPQRHPSPCSPFSFSSGNTTKLRSAALSVTPLAS